MMLNEPDRQFFRSYRAAILTRRNVHSSRRSTISDLEFLTAVFSLQLPRTPHRAWTLASLSQHQRVQEDAPEGPYPALQAAWQQTVLETLVVINGWRTGKAYPGRAWSTERALAIHTASCKRVLHTLAYRLTEDQNTPELHGQIVNNLCATIDEASPAESEQPHYSETELAVHVLFFDGGSRGNPGPGGSGACVGRVDPTTGTGTVLWSAAMTPAHPATTNNQAECQGLITGLRAARQNKWLPLEVVGDSALILGQLRIYCQPKNLCLLRLHAIARRLADLLDVRRWIHHPPAANRMADLLANHAMDHRRSSQVMHPMERTRHVTVDITDLICSMSQMRIDVLNVARTGKREN